MEMPSHSDAGINFLDERRKLNLHNSSVAGNESRDMKVFHCYFASLFEFIYTSQEMLRNILKQIIAANLIFSPFANPLTLMLRKKFFRVQVSDWQSKIPGQIALRFFSRTNLMNRKKYFLREATMHINIYIQSPQSDLFDLSLSSASLRALD